MAITDTIHSLSDALCGNPHALKVSQQLPKEQKPAQRGRIADQQQLVPCACHADGHAEDVRQETNLAFGVAACQVDGSDIALVPMRAVASPWVRPWSEPIKN